MFYFLFFRDGVSLNIHSFMQCFISLIVCCWLFFYYMISKFIPSAVNIQRASWKWTRRWAVVERWVVTFTGHSDAHLTHRTPDVNQLLAVLFSVPLRAGHVDLVVVVVATPADAGAIGLLVCPVHAFTVAGGAAEGRGGGTSTRSTRLLTEEVVVVLRGTGCAVAVLVSSDLLSIHSPRTRGRNSRPLRTVRADRTRVRVAVSSSLGTVVACRTQVALQARRVVAVVTSRTNPAVLWEAVANSAVVVGHVAKRTGQGHVAALWTVGWVLARYRRVSGVRTVIPPPAYRGASSRSVTEVAGSAVYFHGRSLSTLELLSARDALSVFGVVGAEVAWPTEWTVADWRCPRDVLHPPRWTQSRLIPLQTEVARGTWDARIIIHSWKYKMNYSNQIVTLISCSKKTFRLKTSWLKFHCYKQSKCIMNLTGTLFLFLLLYALKPVVHVRHECP